MERIESLYEELNDLEDLSNLEMDHQMLLDLINKAKDFKKRIGKEEIKVLLSQKYDKRNALIHIFAGAGGQDSQDWATILLRMYERYSESQGFKVRIINQSFGEAGGPDGRIGTKEVILEVRGKYAFGILRPERGVHRLVRLSPFSSKSLRHTSFAMVDVLPEIDEKDDRIDINPDEIKVDTFKASSPGGQNVNKRETAIRITHIPTGIVATSQNERMQSVNKEKAMKILMSRLIRHDEEKREKEIQKIKGEKIDFGWGSQIRSYVLHPYKMVKDLRTGVETSDPESVLEGNLDEFIEAGIRWSHQQKKKQIIK